MNARKQQVMRQILNDVLEEKLKAPISGGNSFETGQIIEAKSDLAKENLEAITNANAKADAITLNRIKMALNKLIKKNIETKKYENWQLLFFHANYFTNTLKFDITDIKLTKLVNMVIRGAFLWGKAGIYFDDIGTDNQPVYFPRAVYITNIEKDVYDNITKASIYPLNKMLWDSSRKVADLDVDKLEMQELNENQCKNIVMFQWGTNGMGAYLWLMPFIIFQNQLLQQAIVDSAFQGTKLEFLSSNIASGINELETVADPLNPFLVSYIGNTMQQKFRCFEMNDKNGQSNFIEYYKQAIGIWYEIIGRETNIDYKARTLASEVSLTENLFDVVQYEYKKWFSIFLRELKQHDYVALNKIDVIEGEYHASLKNDGVQR